MSISKVNIEEANAHLRKLHKRVFELENKIHMQALHVEELQQANLQLQQQLKKATQASEGSLAEQGATVTQLTRRLEESEQHVQKLLEAARERDATVLRLEKKARLFYEVVEHRSSIARVLEVLDELSLPDGEEIEKEGGNESKSNPGGTRTAGSKVDNVPGSGSGAQDPGKVGTSGALEEKRGGAQPDIVTRQQSKETLEPN